MATSKNENLFTLWEKVQAVLNVNDQSHCDLTYANILTNTFSVTKTANDLMEIKLFATYTAKNDDLMSILDELSNIERTISRKILSGMEELGYKVTNHCIDENSIGDQYEDFNPGSEHEFSALMFTFNLSKPALKIALASCADLNKSLKKNPIYYSHAVLAHDEESMVLDLANLKLKNQSCYALRLGNEYLMNDYQKFAMGLAPDFQSAIFTETFEPLIVKKVIFTNIEADVVLSDSSELKIVIDCSTNIGAIKIYDKEDGQSCNILSLTSLEYDFFELSQAQMKKFLTKHLVRGAKITDLSVNKFNHKLELSNNARYKEIHLFVSNPLDSERVVNPMRIVINKKGEISAHTNKGITHPNNAAISEHFKQLINGDVIKDIFSQNRRFAYCTLKNLCKLQNKYNRILFA